MDDRDLLSTLSTAGMVGDDGDPVGDPDDATAALDDPEPADAADPDSADAQDAAASDPSPDADEAPSEPDLPESVRDELESLRQERTQVRAALQEQQRQESERYWAGEWQRIEGEKARYQQAMYAEAEKAYNPAEFIRQRNQQIEQWHAGQTTGYYGAREQALWQFQAQKELPRYAEAVATHWGLPADDVPRLLALSNPNDMNAMADALRAARQTQKAAKARELAGALPGPGSGRASGNRPKAGSDAHLALLFRAAGAPAR